MTSEQINIKLHSTKYILNNVIGLFYATFYGCSIYHILFLSTGYGQHSVQIFLI